MSGCIAVLNAGSSSLKFAIYEASDGEPLLFRGQIEGIGAKPRLEVDDADHHPVAEQAWPDGLDHAAAAREVLLAVRALVGDRGVAGVGHRVVHGGVQFAE